MSTPVAPLNLAGLAVGATGTVALPIAGAGTLRLQNESGCGLALVLESSGRGFNLAAGQWLDIAIQPSELRLDYTVVYLLANAPVSLLLMTGFDPSEPVPAMGVLGNSPIGLSGQVAAVVSQVINDGNTAPAVVVEATPSGGSSDLKLNNDGSGYISGGAIMFDNAGTITYMAGDKKIIGPASKCEVDFLGNGDIHLKSNNGFAFVDSDQDIVLNLGATGNILHVQSAGADKTLFDGTGRITQLAGQPSAGSFGIPVIVAQAVRIHITATGNQTLITYTPDVNMVLRINAYVAKGNATINADSMFVTWYDPDIVPTTQQTGLQAGGVGSLVPHALAAWDGATQFGKGAAVAIPIVPLVIVAKASDAVTVIYNDPSGTPDDYLTVIIERLA